MGRSATCEGYDPPWGRSANKYSRWWQALNAAKGIERFEMDDDEREVWKQEQAESYAERIAKALGPKLPGQPEIAAMALERYFGRRLKDLVTELRQIVPDEETEVVD